MVVMEPVEDYLDRLYLQLDCAPRDARRILDESAAHLRDAADEGEANGMSRADAERAAVDRFGAPEEIARACRRAAWQRDRVGLGVTVARRVLSLIGVGLIAVGASGLVALAMNHLFGRSFVGQLPQTYSAASCRHFAQLHPGAGGCAQAALLENADDAVTLRLLAGALGILVLLVAWLSRHRDRGGFGVLPGLFAPIVALTVFGTGAALLAGQSVDLAVTHGSGGVGFYLSGAVVATVASAGYAVALRRRLLGRAVRT